MPRISKLPPLILSSTLALLAALQVLDAQVVDKKLVIVGSSVGRGFGAYTAGTYQNDDLDDVDGNGSADSFATFSYTGRIRDYLLSKGWTFDNQSIGGNDTADVLARFDTDIVPENPEFVLIALSMGNEGLTFTSDPDSVFESFRDGLQDIIQKCRAEGYYPVIGLVYPNGNYNLRKHDFVKRMNLLINTWDVPSINLLGATSDGRGKWVPGQQYGTLSSGNFVRLDAAHPNIPGYEEMYHAFVPTLFEAIDQGKTSTPSYPSSDGFLRLTADAAAPAPVTFTPTETFRGFTQNFKVRTTDTGTVAAVRVAAEPLFLVDFGPSNDDDGRATSSPDSNGNTWNSWRPAAGGANIPVGSTLSNLTTVDNSASTVSLEVSAINSGSLSANGILNGGLLGANGPSEAQLGKLAIESATEDYFFTGGEVEITLSGLDPNSRYTIRLFGSRTSTSERITQFSLESGLPYETLAYQRTSGENIGSNTPYDGNDDEIALFGGIPPNGSNEIVLKIEEAIGGNAYLAMMEILVDSSGAGTDVAHIEVRDSSIAYVAPDGREITMNVDANDGSWYEVALSHSYSNQETSLFVDGQLAGSLRETLEPDQFILGGSGILSNDAPASADYQDWALYRAPWNADEALAQHKGALQQASLELLSPFNDLSFPASSPVVNTAQSLSTAIVNSANATAGSPSGAPSHLTGDAYSATSIELSWLDNSSTETSFSLERRPSGGDSAWSTVDTIAADPTNGTVFYTDTSLAEGTSYDYRVSTNEATTQSDYSNVLTLAAGSAGERYREWADRFFDLPSTLYRIDFNDAGTPNYGGEIWNTVNSISSSTPYQLADSSGDRSANYKLTLTRPFNTSRNANGDPLTGYPTDAQRTSFHVNVQPQPVGAQLVLSGLNRNAYYDITFFSRRGSVVSGFDYRGRFTFTGGGSAVSFEEDSELNAQLAAAFLSPDSAGNIVIDITAADIPTGTTFAGINFMTVREMPPLPPAGAYLVDLNDGSPNYPADQTWNTISGTGTTTATSMVDINGSSAAGYTYAVTQAFNGTRTGNPVPNGFAEDAESSLFLANTAGSTIEFAGLDTGATYDLILLASRGPVFAGFDYNGSYTVSGSTVSNQVIDGTLSSFSIIEDVAPSGSGTISLTVAEDDTINATDTDFPILNLVMLVPQSATSTQFDPNDDPGEPDLSNLQKYAYGLDPTVDGQSLPQLTIGNISSGKFTASYSRSQTANDVDFIIQSTTDLTQVNDSWVEDQNLTERILSADGTVEIIQFERSTSGDVQRFFRRTETVNHSQ